MSCRELDGQVVRRHQQIADLMERFVCVRLVEVNELDLSLFQFDPDLTFAVFFLNADGTIYGRFGSRSDFQQAARDVSLEGLRAAMDAALELHEDYPSNKAELIGKTGPPPGFENPAAYPWIQQRNNQNNCIHCHHIGNAQQMVFRAARQPLPEELLFPWPMPDAVGLQLDPKQKATVKRVLSGSPAERAAFKMGDEILTVAGQSVLSIADVQWVLQNTGETAKLELDVSRGDETHKLTLSLEKGWRRNSDPSWRVTTGFLRRMALGSLRLEEISGDARRTAGIGDDKLALSHNRILRDRNAAYQAGFRRGDILISFDGLTNRMSEAEILAYTLKNKMPGDEVPITVLRAGKPIRLKLLVQ